jgi:hypothetical protein
MDRIKQIKPKWTEVNTPAQAMDTENDTIVFVPPRSITSLAQGLRTLTKKPDELPVRRVPRVRRQTRAYSLPTEVTVYMSTAVHAPPKLQKCAAAANFYGVNDGRNKGFRIPEKEEQGPYAAEIYAALEAVRNADTSSTLIIVSCQSFIQNAMNKKLSVWEHEGWVNVRHREVLKCLAAELKARKGSTFFEVVEPGTEARARCREATLLAKTGRTRDDCKQNRPLDPGWNGPPGHESDR